MEHTKITLETCKVILATEKYLKSLKKVKGMPLKVTNHSYWPSFPV